MASLPGRQTASFFAIQPIPSATPLDDEFNAMVGASGFLNGGTTGKKLLVKSSDAADPPLEIDQVGAGPLAEWKQNGVLKASIENDGDFLANGITGAAGVYTFGSIPVGPAASPTTDNQLARKKYVDDKTTAFSTSWQIVNPSTFPTADYNELPVFICPNGTAVTVTHIKAVFRKGSHTSGGSVTFAVEHLNAGGGGAVSGSTITLDNTNNTVRTVYTATLSLSLSAGDQLTVGISARSGTVDERNVTIAVVGTQKLT